MSTPKLTDAQHVVLLGDSIFDNKAYTSGGPDVIAQLSSRLPAGSRASLRAVDGACVVDMAQQLRRLPSDASHLVVSAGGNDALAQMDVLQEPAHTVAAALSRLADLQSAFAADYKLMLDGLAALAKP